MRATEIEDCIVVGAGPAGLAMSEALAERGISHQVLERGQVGHSWRTQRWAGLRLNSPSWLNRSLHGEGDDYPTAGWAVQRMAEIAHRLPVETGVPVLQLSRVHNGFLLLTPEGRHRARTVVVATGDANVPKVPRLAAELPARLIQLHSAYYASPDELPPGAVLLIGSGQSGAQIADELLDAGREVIIATSPVGRVPLWRRGHDAVRILIDVGFFDMPTADLPDPAMVRDPQPLLAPRRNLSLGRLERKGAVLAGRLVGVQGETVTFAGSARSGRA